MMSASPTPSESPILIPHVTRGEVRIAADVEHRSRSQSARVATPRIILDELVWPRHEPVPALDLPIMQVIDFLAELGQRLAFDRNRYLQEALEQMTQFSTLDSRILENCYRDIAGLFERKAVIAEAEQSLGSLDVLDGWVARNPLYPQCRVRAIPPRLVHVLAGNAPIVPPISIVRGAISKGVHLLKLPSNDMWTASAILRTMADIDPRHPTTRSFAAVYWKGGDAAIESALYRSQYFDKIVVWGGEAAVRHVLKYVGPGLEMLSFDPKVSISMIGVEAFASSEITEDIARRAADDVIGLNQDACSASRFHYVEGSIEQVDAYCEKLAEAMSRDTRYGPGASKLLPPRDVCEQLDMMHNLEPIFRLFGRYDGRGLVIRSEEPVSFSPSGKLVNVVRVASLEEAVRHCTVATQTVGVYPPARRISLRDALASAGAQRIVALGEVNAGGFGGKPHDAGWPVHRFMRWVSEEG
jgi:predicted Zn-dependent protease with MMP-like domain